VRGRVQSVELEVAPRQLQGAGVAVHRNDLAGPAQRRAHREPSRVREAVERARPAARIAPQSEAVLALVEEVARLLARAQVYGDAHAVLPHRQLRGRLFAPKYLAPGWRGVTVAQLVLLVGGLGDLLVAAVDALQRHLAAERVEDGGAMCREPGAVELEHGERAVEIDHHAGQPVALAVHQPRAVGLFGEHVRAPERHRARDAPAPEDRTDGLPRIACEHAHADGAERVVVAARDELPARGHVHDGPRLEPLRWPFDRAPVDPRVPAAQVPRELLLQLQLHRAHASS